MKVANFCEVDPLMPREKQVTRTPVAAVEQYNLNDFHKDLDEATKGPKRAVIKVLKRMLSKHGDFSDFGEKYPEAFQRLEDMCK